MRGKKAVVVAALAVGLSLVGAPGAWASGRPGGPAVTNSGTGTLGSAWKLKSMHDDANGAQIVGEEFEIAPVGGGVGQTWTITFADNGVVFFTGTQVATATGIRVVESTANQPGIQHMTAYAVDQDTGEVVDGSVDLPPLG